jgi:hypothetical protein
MRRKSGYVVGCGAAVAMLSFVASLEVEVAAARTGAEPAPVNRTLKGDRMPLVPGMRSVRPAETRRLSDPKLPDECHAAFDPRRNTFSAEVAGRCLG